MPKITACVICKNEEERIERALKSLAWADEIVVVDSMSTDRTPEIAKKLATKFIQREWPGFAKQKQFAMEQASHDWVFFLDSDEFCTPELIAWLEKFKKVESPPHKLYKIHRKEHMFGKWFKYGCGNPSYQDRLYYRVGVQYASTVHEYPVVEGTPGWVHEYIHHDSFDSIQDMVEKMNQYSTVEAIDMYRRGIRHGWPYMFFSGLVMFYKGYLKKKGFLDGAHGFIMATFDGLGFFMRQLKLWRLWQMGDRETMLKRLERKAGDLVL